MPDIPTQEMFEAQFERRFDELITWAIANSPKSIPLTGEKFLEVRNKSLDIIRGKDGIGDTDALNSEPEPAEGGAQYVNVSPAPWP